MADSTHKKGFIGLVQRIGTKIARTFLDIRSELKKVIWPDRRKLIQSTSTVIAIVLVFGIVIWVVDSVLAVFLESIGFFQSKTPVATIAPTSAITGIVTPSVTSTPAAS